MKRAVLVMTRASLAQGLMQKSADDPDLCLLYETDYSSAETAICHHRADAVLLEVTEGQGHGAEECLALCGRLRKSVPLCRLILMCPETDERAVKKVILARRNRQIDDFVFYDVSMDYIITIFRALCCERTE